MKSNLFFKWDLYAFEDVPFRRYCRTSKVALTVYMLTITALYKNDGEAMSLEDLVDAVLCYGLVTEQETRDCIRLMTAADYRLLLETKNGKLMSKRVNKEFTEHKNKSDKQRANIQKRWDKVKQDKELKNIPRYNNGITMVLPSKYHKEQEQEQDYLCNDDETCNDKATGTGTQNLPSSSEKNVEIPVETQEQGEKSGIVCTLADLSLYDIPQKTVDKYQKQYPDLNAKAIFSEIALKSRTEPSARRNICTINSQFLKWFTNRQNDFDNGKLNANMGCKPKKTQFLHATTRSLEERMNDTVKEIF